MRWGVEMKEGKEEKRAFWSFLSSPPALGASCPSGPEQEKDRRWNEEGPEEVLTASGVFLPTLFRSPSLWEFVPPPLFLLCTFLLCIPFPPPPFCTVTCCRDLPPKKALLCSLYFQFYRPRSHSLAVSTVNISIKPALALCCALSVSLCLSPIFQLSIRAQIIQEHRHLISSEMTHWAHAVSNDASSCSYLIPRRKIKNCPAEPWV